MFSLPHLPVTVIPQMFHLLRDCCQNILSSFVNEKNDYHAKGRLYFGIYGEKSSFKHHSTRHGGGILSASLQRSIKTQSAIQQDVSGTCAHNYKGGQIIQIQLQNVSSNSPSKMRILLTIPSTLTALVVDWACWGYS